MNKFGAFAILALAALAVSSALPIDDEAMTQAILQTTDQEETAQLAAKNLEAFSDFCISSRDYILADIKTQTNQASAKAFGMFFSSAAEIGRESMEVQQRATEKLTAQLANPETPVDGAAEGVDQIISEGQEQIQNQNQPRALLTAFKTAITAVSSKVGKLVSDRLNSWNMPNPSMILSTLNSGCDQIAKYETEIRGQFEVYKSESLGEDAAKYASLSLDAVPCATSSKIIRSEGMCGLLRVAASPVKKIFGQ